MAVARDLGVLGVHLGLGFVLLFIGWIGRIGPCKSKRFSIISLILFYFNKNKKL